MKAGVSVDLMCSDFDAKCSQGNAVYLRYGGDFFILVFLSRLSVFSPFVSRQDD